MMPYCYNTMYIYGTPSQMYQFLNENCKYGALDFESIIPLYDTDEEHSVLEYVAKWGCASHACFNKIRFLDNCIKLEFITEQAFPEPILKQLWAHYPQLTITAYAELDNNAFYVIADFDQAIEYYDTEDYDEWLHDLAATGVEHNYLPF